MRLFQTMRYQISVFVIGALAVLASLSHLAAAADQAVPGLLFYASFDGDDERSSGFTEADVARGSSTPRNLSDVRFRADGRVNGAVHVPANGVFTFDAVGNVKTRRGTMAFWVSSELPLFSQPYRGGRHPQMVVISDVQRPDRANPFLMIRVNGPRRQLQFSAVGAEWSPGTEWQPGEWHHVAITWDAARGRRVYHNGGLVLDHEALEFRPPALDQINLASQWHAGTRRGAVDLGFSFDELYIFDYELTADQVQRLMRENQPPQRQPATAAQREADAVWLRNKFELDDAQIPSHGSGVLQARRLLVDRIDAAYRDERRRARVMTRLPMDGKQDTGSSADEVSVRFADADTYNFVRVLGGFRGTLREGTTEVGRFTGESRVQRLAAESLGSLRDVLFDNAGGTLGEVDFYDLKQLSEVPSFGSQAMRLHLQPIRENTQAHGRTVEYVRAYYDAEDQAVLPATTAVPPAGRTTIEPYRFYHFITEPMGTDRAVDRVYLDLNVSGFDGPTHMAIRVYDPVTLTRRLSEFESRFEPDNGRVALLLDGNDWLVEAEHPLWFSVMFDRAGYLHHGEDGSRLVIDGDLTHHGENYIAAMERIASDLFVMLSEPRPWYAGAHGTDPPRDLRAVGELFALCEHILRFDPEAPTAAALYSWLLSSRDRWLPEAAARYTDPLESMTLPDPTVEGPAWAVYGREALKATRAYVDWWVNERQDKQTGMLGGGVSDDTTLMPGFVNLALIHDPDNRLREAVRILADYTWHNTLDDGLADYGPTHVRDHLHTYEEGTNVQHLLPRLFYGNPEYIERLIITSRAYEDHLTGINPQGHRLMRSANFSAANATPPPSSARYAPNDPGLAMIFMPGRILTWYNGSPTVRRVLLEWLDGWLHHAPGDASGYFGHGAIDFETGRRVGNRAVGGEIWYHLYWAYELTRDERYREPVLTLGHSGRMAPEWTEWQAMHPDARSVEAIVSRQDGEVSGGYVRLRMDADIDSFVEELKGELLDAKKYLPVHTWVGQSTDRVHIPQTNVARMYLGGLASRAKRLNYHFHAVSWEGADDDVARFVVDKGPGHLKVLIYSFHDVPQDVLMRVWQLEPGRYQVRTGVANGDGGAIDTLHDEREMDLWRYEAVNLTVPPRQVFVLEIEQTQAYDWRVHELPDLAIGPNDVRVEGDTVIVTVHNIGSVQTPATTVQLRREGEVVAEQALPAIAPPNDLQPRTRELRFQEITDTADLTVLVNPDADVREITRVNNEAPVPVASQ